MLVVTITAEVVSDIVGGGLGRWGGGGGRVGGLFASVGNLVHETESKASRLLPFSRILLCRWDPLGPHAAIDRSGSGPGRVSRRLTRIFVH